MTNNRMKWAALGLLIAVGCAATAEAGGPSRGGMKFNMSGGGGRSMSMGSAARKFSGGSSMNSMRSRSMNGMSPGSGGNKKFNSLPYGMSNRGNSLSKNFNRGIVKKLPAGIKLDRPSVKLPGNSLTRTRNLAGRAKIADVTKIGKLHNGGIKLSDIKPVKNFHQGIKISDLVKNPKFPGPIKHAHHHWWEHLSHLHHHHHHGFGFVPGLGVLGVPRVSHCRPYPYPVPAFSGGNVTVIRSTEVVTVPAAVEEPETPAASVAGIDLQVIDVQQLAEPNAEQQTGPKYRISVQNQGNQPVTTPVQLALLAGQDATMQPCETALVEIASLAAGATSTMDVELPFAVMELKQAAGEPPTEYKVLLVFIDSGKTVEEADEENNAVILDRVDALAAN